MIINFYDRNVNGGGGGETIVNCTLYFSQFIGKIVYYLFVLQYMVPYRIFEEVSPRCRRVSADA